MGYGTGPWGTGAWGLGSGGSSLPISIVSAEALTTRTVVVDLTTAPQTLSVLAEGDATNPATWIVVREDTGYQFTVLLAQVAGSLVTLTLLEDMGPVTVAHKVSAPTLNSASGAPIVPPTFFAFPGLLAATQQTPYTQQAAAQLTLNDVQNQPTPTSNSDGGVLAITPEGDYALTSGADLLRKLVIRRLTTPPGSFRHLPDYGCGVVVKRPLPTSNLVKLQAEIVRQVSLEPEVAKVAVQITTSLGSGTFLIQMQIQTRASGQLLNVMYPTTGKSLVLQELHRA